MKDFPDVSWINKKRQLTSKAMTTLNRLDDSIKVRGHTVKTPDVQKIKHPKINISDAMFNEVPNMGPGATIPYNKARMKLFGAKVEKIDKFFGKKSELNHI